MVELKPAFLHLRGQARQPFVDGRPRTEGFQSLRTSVEKCFFEVEEPLIVDVVVEVHIDLYHLVVQQKPAGFGKEVFIGFYLYGADGE